MVDILSDSFFTFFDFVAKYRVFFGLLGGLICAYLGAFGACLLYFVIFRHMRKPKGHHVRVKRSCFWRVIAGLPYRRALDWISYNPAYFAPNGVTVFTGEQGAGKTVALVEQSLQWQREYPVCKCISNLGYKYADDELRHWSQLTDYNNGIFGVLVQIDELQNWFSSSQSRNFPPEMLEIVTQNRKNRRAILGTAQSFNRLSKQIREQTKEVRACATLLGCITFVVRKKPIIDNTGEVKRWKYRGIYCFLHTEKIRSAYDTYHVIHRLSEDGFLPASERLDLPRGAGTS